MSDDHKTIFVEYHVAFAPTDKANTKIAVVFEYHTWWAGPPDADVRWCVRLEQGNTEIVL